MILDPAATGSTRTATASYVGAMLLLSTLGVFAHEIALPAPTTVFFRCGFGALALALYCHWNGWLTRASMTGQHLRLAIVSGLLAVLNWVCFFEGLYRIGISLATIVFHVQPFLVLLLGALWFGERIAPAKLAWVALGFAGLVLACGMPAAAGAPSQIDAVGILYTLVAALAYAGVTLTTRSMRGMRAELTALVHCSVGVLVLLPFVALPAAGISARQWGWLTGIGVLPTALAFALIYGALPRMQPASIAVLTFAYPAAAIGVDCLVYGQRLGAGQAAGVALIALASLASSLASSLNSRPTRLLTTPRKSE